MFPPSVTRASCSAQQDCESINPKSDATFRKEHKMSRPLALDTPVIIIGKTMLMHERVHRRAAKIPDALRKAVHRGGFCESCDDLMMNAVATAASGVGPVQLRHNVWPHVRIRLPAPGGVSSTSNWYGPEGRRSACARWLFQRFGDDGLFRPRSVRKQLQCVD